jgi:hypothetical protein
METTLAQLAGFSIAATLFGTSLLSVIVTLSLLRQMRLMNFRYAVHPVDTRNRRNTQTFARQRVENFPVLQSEMSAGSYQASVPLTQSGADQIIIQIVPDEPVRQSETAKAS